MTWHKMKHEIVEGEQVISRDMTEEEYLKEREMLLTELKNLRFKKINVEKKGEVK